MSRSVHREEKQNGTLTLTLSPSSVQPARAIPQLKSRINSGIYLVYAVLGVGGREGGNQRKAMQTRQQIQGRGILVPYFYNIPSPPFAKKVIGYFSKKKIIQRKNKYNEKENAQNNGENSGGTGTWRQ
jgi:hypothetical protein